MLGSFSRKHPAPDEETKKKRAKTTGANIPLTLTRSQVNVIDVESIPEAPCDGLTQKEQNLVTSTQEINEKLLEMVSEKVLMKLTRALQGICKM